MTTEATKVSIQKTVKDLVAEKLEAANTSIVGLIVEDLAQVEVLKRKEQLKTAITKLLPEAQTELKKLSSTKTDLLDAEGKEIVKTTWTKPEVKAIQDAKDKLAKVEGAIDVALNKNDWTKLTDLVK